MRIGRRALVAALVLTALSLPAPPSVAEEPRQHAAGMLEALQEQLAQMEQDLARLHGRSWDGFARYERERIRDGLRQFLEMAPHEREAVRMHAIRFEELSAAERYRLCRQFRIERGYYPPPCLLPR